MSEVATSCSLVSCWKQMRKAIIDLLHSRNKVSAFLVHLQVLIVARSGTLLSYNLAYSIVWVFCFWTHSKLQWFVSDGHVVEGVMTGSWVFLRTFFRRSSILNWDRRISWRVQLELCRNMVELYCRIWPIKTAHNLVLIRRWGWQIEIYEFKTYNGALAV